MNDRNNLSQVSPILGQYAIKPYFVEDLGKVQRVYADKGEFALKKVPPNLGTDFIRHVQFLYQKGYNRIIPIYPTMDGRYAVLHQNALYYLMPWLANPEKERIQEKNNQLFRELARMHTLSTKEFQVKKEERQEHYDSTVLQLEKDEEFIVGFLENCEQKTYPSPFELQFCLYYHDVHQAIRYSKRKLEDWFEKTKEDEKVRTVITHGKFSPEHFVYDERGYGYFMNFERSQIGSPYHDLLPYISRALRGFPKRCEDCIDWLLLYQKYYPLQEGERLLMMSYFAHPGSVLRVVKDYYKKQPRKNERKFSRRLQRKFWQLKNTEYVIMRLEEIERQRKEAAEAQAAAQQAQEEAQN